MFNSKKDADQTETYTRKQTTLERPGGPQTLTVNSLKHVIVSRRSIRTELELRTGVQVVSVICKAEILPLDLKSLLKVDDFMVAVWGPCFKRC